MSHPLANAILIFCTISAAMGLAIIITETFCHDSGPPCLIEANLRF